MADERLNIPVQPLMNPLTQDDHNILQKVLEDNRAHKDLIERCAECGLDMHERMARAEMHKEVASKLIEKFFPTMLSPTGQQ